MVYPGQQDGFLAYHFGTTGTAVIADQDNDGRSEITVWRPTDGVWYSLNLANGNSRVCNSGPTAIYPYPRISMPTERRYRRLRPTTGYWYLSQSTNGLLFVPFGIAEDIPAPAIMTATARRISWFGGFGRGLVPAEEYRGFSRRPFRVKRRQTGARELYSLNRRPVPSGWLNFGRSIVY